MSHIQQLGPKRYQARWNDPSGKQRTKVFAKKTDAQRHLIAMEHAKLSGSYVDPAAGRVTVRAVAEEWAASRVNLTPTTRALYESVLRNHVLPRWADVQLSGVEYTAVQAWVSQMIAAGISPGHIHKIHGVLHGILQMAVRSKRLPTNPAAEVQLPRVVERPRRYLTARQVSDLADRAAALPPGRPRRATDAAFGQYELVVLVLAYCGLRWGEMAALRVQRVDLLRRRIAVSESVTEVNGATLHWGPPKSHESRSVPVPAFLVDALAAHLGCKAPDDLVFTSPDGGVLRNRNARRAWFDRAAREIGLEGLTPHELRHTAASLAVSAGANVKAVQRMLGHASAVLTLDRYADLFDDDLDAVADRLDVMFRERESGRNQAKIVDLASVR